eukprot:15190_1
MSILKITNQMPTIDNKKRKIDQVITNVKVVNLNDAPATKKMKQTQQNINDDSVIVTDEVIFKKEIKIEPNKLEIDGINQENTSQKHDNDVVICSVIQNSNNSNQSIDLVKADHMNCFVKFCPHCKIQVN